MSSGDDTKNPPPEIQTGAATSSAERNEGAEKPASKRNYLEVNKTDTMKKLLVKPSEIKPMKPSEALARVREFLPLLKESTNKLVAEAKIDPLAVDIENVGEEDEHIEMNLALMPENSDSDSDDDESDEDEDSDEQDEDDESPNDTEESINQLGLGFKVKDPNRIKRLKLEKPSANNKKPLISEINTDEVADEKTGENDS